MKAKHTEGPWRRGTRYNEIEAGPTVDPIHIAELDTGPFGAKGTFLLPGTVDANGNLIAAAPDLLAACEIIHACSTGLSNGNEQARLDDIAQIARAAIAKAKG